MRTIPTGVIGHVDHGKTALVKALTGIDTDRLKEEKERGVSIVPGFSYLAVPGGEIDLIDMPGHERFVRAMISGATGIESVLLVVAANDGIKPQTVEHVDIADLVGARRGVIAITKIDLVTHDEARRMAEAVRRFVADTCLRNAPLVFTSVATGAGLDALAQHLAGLVADETDRDDHGFFYLPVDRAFAVPGYGAVVTGTLRRGLIAVGDEVELAPGGHRAHVRSLQVHNRPLAQVRPGRRTAVNLRGIDAGRLRPGLALASPGLLTCSQLLDVELRLLASVPHALENGRAVRLLLGTTETSARVRLLHGDQLLPGTSAFAQLRSRDELVVPAGEPFILRSYSPPRTIGGGRILDPDARRHRRFDEASLRFLRVLSEGAPSDVIRALLLKAGYAGCRLETLARVMGLSPAQVRIWTDQLKTEQFGDGTVMEPGLCDRLRRQILKHLQEFHRQQPLEPGLRRDRLRPMLPEGLSTAVFDGIVVGLARRGEIVQVGTVIRHTSFDPAALLSPRDRAMASRIAEVFRRADLMPPDLDAVIGQEPRRRQILSYLVRAGTLVRTLDRVQKREIVFHRDALKSAQRIISEALSSPEGFLVREAGAALGISRKFSIPLLEYLDAVKFTRRIGDRRIVTRHPAPISSRGPASTVSRANRKPLEEGLDAAMEAASPMRRR